MVVSPKARASWPRSCRTACAPFRLDISAGDRRRRIHPAERPRRYPADAPRQGGGKSRRASRNRQRNDPAERAGARGRSDGRGKERPEGRRRQDRDARTTPQQAETLALSRQLGTLSLALRSLLDSQSPTPEGGDDAERQERVDQYGAFRREHASTTALMRTEGIAHGGKDSDPGGGARVSLVGRIACAAGLAIAGGARSTRRRRRLVHVAASDYGHSTWRWASASRW